MNDERRKLLCLACDKLCFESHLSALFLTAHTCPGCEVWFLTIIRMFWWVSPVDLQLLGGAEEAALSPAPREGSSGLPAGSPALLLDLLTDQCSSFGHSPALPLLSCLWDCSCLTLRLLWRAWGDRRQPPVPRAVWWMCPRLLRMKARRSR